MKERVHSRLTAKKYHTAHTQKNRKKFNHLFSLNRRMETTTTGNSRKRLRRCNAAAPSEEDGFEGFGQSRFNLESLLLNTEVTSCTENAVFAAPEHQQDFPKLDIFAALTADAPASLESPQLSLDVSGKRHLQHVAPTSPLDPKAKAVNMLLNEKDIMVRFQNFGVV